MQPEEALIDQATASAQRSLVSLHFADLRARGTRNIDRKPIEGQLRAVELVRRAMAYWPDSQREQATSFFTQFLR